MRRYIIAAIIAVPALVLVFLGAGYVKEEMISSDEVSRGVTAAGSDLSRMGEDEATATVAAYETQLVSQPVNLVIDGKPVTLDPADVGVSIDEEDVVEIAMNTRRKDSLISNIGAWFGTFTSSVDVEVPITYDEDALILLLEEWSKTEIGKPAYEGAVIIDNATAYPEYPQAGLRIEVDEAVPLIVEQLLSTDRQTVEVPLEAIEPVITDGDVDVAVVTANKLIERPIVLKRPGAPATMAFTPTGLASALRSEIVVNSPATIEVYLDPDALIEIAERSAEEFAIPPTDATFTFNDRTKTFTIVPSVQGQKVDLEAIPEAVVRTAYSTGVGIIPMTEGDEAEFTTEMAEAMGPLGEVSSFTTYHPCCQSRVTNIQLLADEIRGAIVMPGEEFSVNDHAGQRTLAEGYVRAGAIINGRVECCDSAVNIGGGTSQFATTLYNAVFFGCYEDVFHQPHSLYFSRYPFVREATLGFPAPDVRFRNDSEHVLAIDTTYTSGSITVTLYGNNGGRTCTSERNGNTITRVMEWPDGSVTTQDWTWYYKQPREDEPEPTTTTTGATTTTTGATTTTTAPTTTTTTVETTTTTVETTTTTVETTTTTVETTTSGEGG